jgi:hypothetical protein
MALTATQLVTVAEITLETLDTVEALASSLTAEQETSIGTDITLWNTIRNSHVKVTKDIDFDNERKREAIRRRVRKALGLSLISFEIQPGSFSVASTPIF